MKKNKMSAVIAVIVVLFVVFLACRQLDMSVTIDQQQSQIAFYKRQQEEIMRVMNGLVNGATLSKIKVVSDEVLLGDFTKKEGTSIVVGSLKYEFKDGWCVGVSIEE